MYEDLPSPARKRIGLKLALVGGGVAAGAIIATAMGANAATSSTSRSGTATTGGYAAGPAPVAAAASGSAPSGAPQGHGGATPVRSDEKSPDSAQTATLKAAALKAVPGGTVYRVETDAGDGTYEAHMTKADGTLVTVKFDKNLAVTKVESGMGTGDPRPAGQPAGGPGGPGR